MARETLGTLPHTHLDILPAKTHFGLGMGRAAARLARSAGVWQARTARRVAMLPGTAGANVRKTARYAGKDCDPLQYGAAHCFVTILELLALRS